MTAQDLVNYTNQRLNNWYNNVKLDYGVIGNGTTKIENNEVTINFTEDGVSKKWSMCFYPEYVSFGLDYIFNVWMEQAR